MTEKADNNYGVDVSQKCEFWYQSTSKDYRHCSLINGENDRCDCPERADCYPRRLLTELQRTQTQYNEVVEQNKSLQQELKQKNCAEKFPNQCRCAFRCLDNEFCNDAEKRINRYKQALKKIECGCNEIFIRTKECKDFKKLILNVINEMKG